jgi:hypothetical protein
MIKNYIFLFLLNFSNYFTSYDLIIDLAYNNIQYKDNSNKKIIISHKQKTKEIISKLNSKNKIKLIYLYIKNKINDWILFIFENIVIVIAIGIIILIFFIVFKYPGEDIKIFYTK